METPMLHEQSTLTEQQSVIDRTFFDIMEPLEAAFGFKAAFEEELNIWQKVAADTHDIVTPANVLDVAGFGATMYGLSNLDSWHGLFTAAGGLMTDVVDGKLARATGTSSPLGEAIDAGGDKIKLAYGLYKLWQLDLAPKPLITAIAIQNGLNVALTTIDQITHDQPILHPTQFGKKAMFLQQSGLGMHAIGSELSKTYERRGRVVKLAGTVLAASGVVLGSVATYDYASTLWNNRKSKRGHR